MHEVTETFPLSVTLDLPLQQLAKHAHDVRFLSVDDEERMRSSPLLAAEEVSSLFSQKDRLNDIFDSGRAWCYYAARDEHFPQDVSGSAKRRNRAGDKIAQADEHSGFALQNACCDNGTFIDICGGPGAFAFYFLEAGAAWGVGITLVDDGSDWWYKNLLHNSHFTALYGSDGNGNGALVRSLVPIFLSIVSALKVCLSFGQCTHRPTLTQ